MNDSCGSQLNFHWASEEQVHVADSPPLIIRTCRHVLEGGCLCRAAAVRGRRYCRAHGLLRLRQRKVARSHRKLAVVVLPRLTDLQAVETGHTMVRVVEASGRMDAYSARVAQRALRQAGSAMRFIAWQGEQMAASRSVPGRVSQPRRQQDL